jgi:hypothetical protein
MQITKIKNLEMSSFLRLSHLFQQLGLLVFNLSFHIVPKQKEMTHTYSSTSLRLPNSPKPPILIIRYFTGRSKTKTSATLAVFCLPPRKKRFWKTTPWHPSDALSVRTYISRNINK